MPRKLVAINAIRVALLAAITGGGTVAANAASYAAADAMAWEPACCICPEVVFSRPM